MMSPYRLPDGPVAIQFSGGRTSGYMLNRILDAHNGELPADAHVLFQNTGREMPETLDFVQECSSRWSVPVAWVEYRDDEQGYEVVSHNSASRNGEPFEALIRKRQFLPNQQARFCTSMLKVRPARRYMVSLGYERWQAAIGIRADEAHRAKQDREGRHTSFWPLLEAGVTKRDVAAWWERQPFELHLPHVNGSTALGNCDGCFLKSEKNRAYLARYRPDRAQWWRDMEAAVTSSAYGDGGRFDRRISWAELIEHAKRQADWVFEDEDAGVYCDTGFGGCHD